MPNPPFDFSRLPPIKPPTREGQVENLGVLLRRERRRPLGPFEANALAGLKRRYPEEARRIQERLS